MRARVRCVALRRDPRWYIDRNYIVANMSVKRPRLVRMVFFMVFDLGWFWRLFGDGELDGNCCAIAVSTKL